MSNATTLTTRDGMTVALRTSDPRIVRLAQTGEALTVRTRSREATRTLLGELRAWGLQAMATSERTLAVRGA